MKKKMAFVDLTNFKDWPMGGMLEYELAILPGLCDHYDVDVFGYSVNGIAPSDLHINGKVYPVYSCGNCSTESRLVPNFWRGLSLLRSKKVFEPYDVIYVHTGSCMTALSKIVNKKKTKLIYHQHGLNHQKDFQLRSLIQRPFLNWAQKASDLVFVVSDEQSVVKYVNEKFANSLTKYVAIGSPVNLSKFNFDKIQDRVSKINGVAKKFVYTGRLSGFKNVKLLVEAFALYVQNECSDAIFNIAGTGEEFDLLKKMSRELNVEDNVNLLGFVPHDEIYALLETSDVFLTASGGEGWSVSVLEANASGLPIICGRVPGLEKQVIDGQTGMFVDNFSPQSFYNKMVELNGKRHDISENCMNYAKQFDSVIITSKIVENIDGLF